MAGEGVRTLLTRARCVGALGSGISCHDVDRRCTPTERNIKEAVRGYLNHDGALFMAGGEQRERQICGVVAEQDADALLGDARRVETDLLQLGLQRARRRRTASKV